MNHAMLAMSFYLLAQASGESGQFDPIRVPARQAAPPADLGTQPEPSAAPSDLGAPVGDVPAEAATEPPVEAPDRYRSAPESLAEPPGGEVPVETLADQPRQKLRPPELIAEALENPAAEALPGAPLTLAQALAQSADRQQQLKITRAYWQLAAAQARYHWAARQRGELYQQTDAHADLPGAASARAAAEADVSDALVGVETAQHALSGLLRPFGQLSAPLAVDRPHVGDYRMDFESHFGAGAPPRIELIHRTLPVRRKAIDARADAIVAASDAVESAGEQFRESGRGLATLLDAAALLHEQRKAFIADVLAYNLDIADYALSVAPQNLRGDTLVGMLIRTTGSAAGPTRAAAGAVDPGLQKSFRKPSSERGAATTHPDDWTANYAGDSRAVVDDPGVYQGLLEVSSEPLRVQKLGNLLHWDRSLAADAGLGTTLAQCLQNVAGPNREAVIEGYWLAREHAARLQLFSEQQEQLAALQSIAIPLRDQPGMAEAGVRLQAARRAARARALAAQVDLLVAQCELTRLVGRPLSGVWLLPTTAPQSGRYQVSRLGASRGAAWYELMNQQYRKLQHRADAVIQCDAERTDLVRTAREGAADSRASDDQLTLLDRVIWATARQNRQALAFLGDLTEYNRAIARYVLATQPAALSGEELAGKLAIARSTQRDS
jgi:hypothetical protein